MTDEELLTAWRGGDQRAGDQLLTRHFPALYRFFTNKLQHGVEDLVQETFLKAVRSRDAFRGEASFRSYLFVIAKHELYAVLRRQQRRPSTGPLEHTPLVALTESPSELVGRTRQETLLLRALREIPLELQILVELHYWEQLTMTELAVSMQVPSGTVKTRLRKARKLLEAKMEALEKDPVLLRSTIDNLEYWAASVRGAMASD